MRILLAEDDRIIADGLCRSLRQAGYAIDCAYNGLDADTALMTNTYDLVMNDGTVQTVTLSDEMMMPYAKAASRLLTRDPADSTGSWQMLLPQVDKVWAAKGVDGLFGINQIVL